MFGRKSEPAPATPMPLTGADRETVRGVAADYRLTVRTGARGELVLRGLNVWATGAGETLRQLGYAVEWVDGCTVIAVGWRPRPGTATVAEIDARIDELYALRSEAEASNRLAVEA